MIRRLEQKYPNAEISVGNRREKPPKPSDTVVEEVKEPKTKERPEEMSPRKLALERFREKEKEEQGEDSSAKKGESG